MKPLGRGLQGVALVLLPLAMVLQIDDRITLGQMLTLWIAGISLFWIGRIVEGYAGA